MPAAFSPPSRTQPSGAVPGQGGLQEGQQGGLVGEAVAVGAEARVVDHVGAADGAEQPLAHRLDRGRGAGARTGAPRHEPRRGDLARQVGPHLRHRLGRS